ncbi:MAG: thermonuclease family protein [Candidatus Nanohalobium sp.]
MGRKLIDVLLAVVFAVALLNIGVDFSRESGSTVTHVRDGDTLEVEKSDGREVVRLLGVDTPETSGSNHPAEFFLPNSSRSLRCLREMGEKASIYVRENLEGREVKVVTDSESDLRGSYGRLLAYVRYNSSDLGRELLRKGYARVYNSSFSYRKKYRGLERQARREEVGIWSDSCGRKKQ